MGCQFGHSGPAGGTRRMRTGRSGLQCTEEVGLTTRRPPATDGVCSSLRFGSPKHRGPDFRDWQLSSIAGILRIGHANQCTAVLNQDSGLLDSSVELLPSSPKQQTNRQTPREAHSEWVQHYTGWSTKAQQQLPAGVTPRRL